MYTNKLVITKKEDTYEIEARTIKGELRQHTVDSAEELAQKIECMKVR